VPPLADQAEQPGIVLAAVTGCQCGLEHGCGLGAECWRDAGLRRHRQRQRRILGQQRGVGARFKIAGQCARHPVGADPAVTAGLLDHRQRLRAIQPQLLSQRDGLGRSRQVGRRQQVVDQLGARAVTRPLADVEEPSRDMPQQALMSSPQRRRRGHHQAHATVPGTRRTARHRRVQAAQSSLGQPCGQPLDVGRPDGGAQHHRGTGGQCRSGAGRAEQHGLGLRRIDHHHDQQRAASGHDRRRVGQFGARRGGQRVAREVDVVHPHRLAGVAQPQRHRQPHVADADEGDGGVQQGHLQISESANGVASSGRSGTGPAGPQAHQGQGYLCIRPRLRAIDISMPSATPRVTIAVPP